MKKLVAVLLAMIMIFSVPSLAFATENGEIPPDVSQETVDDGVVATLSVCSAIYVWPISGHTWIYVHNYSDEPIQVGHYEVPVGEGASVGVFSFSVNDGWGIYYNIEAYKENTKNRMDKVWSKTTELDAEELNALNNKLLSYPNYWGFGGNCATFAFSMWNSVTHEGYFSLLIPAITQFMLMVSGAEKGTLEMFCPPREKVYRLKGYGDDAHLEVASDYSVS